MEATELELLCEPATKMMLRATVPTWAGTLTDTPVRPSAALLDVGRRAGTAERALTVAVKVTACPYVEGLAPLLSAVEVAAGLTVWVRVALLLALSLASPP